MSDAITTIDSGEDSSSFSPRDLSGLLLWVDGDNTADVSGSLFATWPDQSGGHRDLHGKGNVQPNDIGGHTAVRFIAASSGSYDFFQAASPDFAIGDDDFVLEVVESFAPGGGSLAFLENPDASTGLSLFGGGGSVIGSAGSSDQGTAALASGAHLVGLYRSSITTAEVRVDGHPTAFAVSAADVLSSPVDFLVGEIPDDPPPGGYLDGDIAEVVLAHNPSASDVTNLESYLKSKYGL